MNYDKITNRYPLSLFGIPLPLTIVREQWRFYDTVPAVQSPAQAEAAMEAILTEQLHHMVDPYGAVRSTLCSSRQRGDTLLVTLSAECREEIGEAAPIYTDDTGDLGA